MIHSNFDLGCCGIITQVSSGKRAHEEAKALFFLLEYLRRPVKFTSGCCQLDKHELTSPHSFPFLLIVCLFVCMI